MREGNDIGPEEKKKRSGRGKTRGERTNESKKKKKGHQKLSQIKSNSRPSLILSASFCASSERLPRRLMLSLAPSVLAL